MRAFEKLPEEYHEIYSVDLQKNKKIAIFFAKNGKAHPMVVYLRKSRTQHRRILWQ